MRIVTQKPEVEDMRLILGGEAARIVMSAGILYYRKDQWGLPLNHAASSIMDGEGYNGDICGNVIIIARNGLRTVI